MHGCQHGIAMVNGTVSLRLGLMAAGLEAESEVIIPPYTFFSTASAVVEANMVPVFADVDLDTFNLDPRAVEAAITPRTRAVIPVHFAGQVADMDAIMAIAAQAQACWSSRTPPTPTARAYQNRPAGSLGHLGSFSFQSSKNLTSGEGGIITTNDAQLAAACRSLHNCGRIPSGVWYEHHVISGNYRLGELQGALLNAQLERLEEQARTRDANGRYLARAAREPAGPPSAAPPRLLHPPRVPPVHVAYRSSGVRRAARRGDRGLAGRGDSLLRGLWLLAPRAAHVSQPRFRPVPAGHHATGSTTSRCIAPTATCLCREQALWLEQAMFLGPREDVDDIYRAFEKIYDQRAALADWFRRESAV